MAKRDMTQTRAVEIAYKVCSHLGRRRPHVFFGKWGCGAWGGPGRIKVGPRSSVQTVLHEVAHHLSTGIHGEAFYQALLMVAEAGSITLGHDYNWLIEYRSIRSRRIRGTPLRRR